MKKILIVSTVSRQFYLFEQGNIEVLKSLGYEVHAAANFSDANERLDALDIIRHPFDIQRSPFSIKNIKAYKQLTEIMKSVEFDVVHCHSPMGGVLARLAARSVGVSTVVYTAHGFHFYRGAPIINWIFYYRIERFLSKYTDILITINHEDYCIAQKFSSNKVVFVPGIGVDTNRFIRDQEDREKKRKELGIESDTVVFLSTGELIKRKNHETALRALSELDYKNYKYLICGRGVMKDYLKELVNILQMEDKVIFLGYRNDIPELCAAADVFIFPSFQEGLPVSVMEAMSAELPIVCSEIRGNSDLIINGEGGFLHAPNDVNGFASSIRKLIMDVKLRKIMGNRNYKNVKRYDKIQVKEEMKKLYGKL